MYPPTLGESTLHSALCPCPCPCPCPYAHAHVPICSYAHVPICSYAHVPMCPCAHMLICPCAHVPMCPYAHMLICPCAHVPMCPCAHMLICPYAHMPIPCPGPVESLHYPPIALRPAVRRPPSRCADFWVPALRPCFWLLPLVLALALGSGFALVLAFSSGSPSIQGSRLPVEVPARACRDAGPAALALPCPCLPSGLRVTSAAFTLYPAALLP